MNERVKAQRAKAISANLSIEDQGAVPLCFITSCKMMVGVTRVACYTLGTVAARGVLNGESVYQSPRNSLPGKKAQLMNIVAYKGHN